MRCAHHEDTDLRDDAALFGEAMEAPKSVPVYALQSPEKIVVLHFNYPEAFLADPANAGKAWHYETAAIISFVYNLTAKRRPQPSEEPERTIYSNLKPWKTVLLPNYVVVADGEDLTGAQVLFWKGRKSLQGTPPWGRPILGTVVGSPGYWAVNIDPIQLAVLKKIEDAKERARWATERQESETRGGIVPALPEPLVIAPEPEEPIDWVNYKGDPLMMTLDGHYMDVDELEKPPEKRFTVPKNFDEFYEKYPKYVLNWVKKRLNKFSIDDDVEDWTQDLLIHMKFLPQGSKHRLPGANGHEQGCTDVIETFNPYKQYGASEKRFRNYFNNCLGNKFTTLQTKRAKNPVCRPGNVPFGNGVSPEDVGNQPFTGDEFVHHNSEYLSALAARTEKQHDDRLFTNQFKRYVKKEDPGVYPAIEALEATGPLGEAAEYMGVTQQEFSRYRVRLKQLGECFLRATQAPKQRRKYRKRSTATQTPLVASNPSEEQNGEKREPQLGQG